MGEILNLAQENRHQAFKLCGIVRAPHRCLFEYICDHERMIRMLPHFVRGGVKRIIDENHVDMVATYKVKHREHPKLWVSDYQTAGVEVFRPKGLLFLQVRLMVGN